MNFVYIETRTRSARKYVNVKLGIEYDLENLPLLYTVIDIKTRTFRIVLPRGNILKQKVFPKENLRRFLKIKTDGIEIIDIVFVYFSFFFGGPGRTPP